MEYPYGRIRRAGIGVESLGKKKFEELEVILMMPKNLSVNR